MKKKTLLMLPMALSLLSAAPVQAQTPWDTPASQMEKLDRGLVVVKKSAGSYFASWRLLGTDNAHTEFELLRDGVSVKANIGAATSMDVSGTDDSEFQVVVYQNGEAVEVSAPVKPWTKNYLELHLNRPAAGSNSDGAYEYTPNDCSVGDVDGDGQYELFVKWDPTNSKDNSQSGFTGNVYLDCYRLSGEQLWRIDLGQNIRAGAHYTQFMVYDFDGDGRAELMCKTAPGSLDGEGQYVNQAATDAAIQAADNEKSWVVSGGRINGGHEYLTVFEGLTGKALHTIAYFPNRNAKAELSDAAGSFNWDDRSGKNDKGNYGNRGERYLAAVAYLGGPDARPSGIFSRGYYTFAYVWAVDFDGQHLSHRWLHSSDKRTSYSVTNADMQTETFTPPASTSGGGSRTLYSNGNHNLSVADVDGDGRDEIVWGSAALDDDGRLLYAVGFGHGDAIHLADLNPDRPGLELFDIHEEKGVYAWDIHDAATGEVLMKGGQSGQDNGRGLAADIVATSRGYEFWSAYGGFSSGERNQNPFSAVTGGSVGEKKPSMNFRTYWDGDELDELLDGTSIGKYDPKNGSTALGIGRTAISSIGSPSSCNSTKSTPCLSADIFGDWREELILWSKTDNATLNIYTTVTPTDYRVPTLMHDHTYRMGVCWQNVAYNQPPHLGYYLPDFIRAFQSESVGISNIEADGSHHSTFDLQGRKVDSSKAMKGVYVQNGRKIIVK